MQQSKQQAPHFYETTAIEMDPTLDLLSRVNVDIDDDRAVTVTAALIHAVTNALQKHPELNSTWDQNQLLRWNEVNLGVAIDTPDGVVAPAILGCDRLGLRETSDALRDLVARSRQGKIRTREWSDATFTVSNLGMFGVGQFTAIVVPPQVAILATGQIEPQVVVRSGDVQVRRMMSATISADHRVVDGVIVARFLQDLKQNLEATRR